MAEYLANAVQTVDLGQPILFTSSIPCPKGYVFHEDETGIFILRGITSGCFARYQVSFQGNIAIPTGGVVTPIAVAITENGEARPTSRSIFTPAAVDQYGNVTAFATITVPKGCCFTVSIRYVSGVTDGTTTPTPEINVINSNLTITRTA